MCKGGSGSGGSGKGGGGGGGGGGAAGGAAGSETNSLGQETAFGGEQKTVANSRLFGANEEVQGLNNYKNYDAATQSGFIDSVVTQMRSRDDSGALTKRASRDLSTLYRNTSSEAKDALASQGLGDLKAKNPAVQRITRDLSKRQARAEIQRQRQRQQARERTRRNRNNDDDDLAGLFS